MKIKKLTLPFLVFFLILLWGCSFEDQSRNTRQSEENRPETTEVFSKTSNLPAKPDQTQTVVIEPSPIERIDPSPTTTSEPELIPCSGVLTSPNQEGPYYKGGSPERESLIEEGMPGTPILIVGRVFDNDCNPLPGVKVDFWLANVEGEYDNIGYTLRGHQFTDENGFYAIESIEPTPYTGRPSHIHVKLFAPDGGELLTTQMYFPGSESSRDVLNAPDLFVTYLEPNSEGRPQVLFNFIVQE